jgi:hypothetical protein
MLILLSRTGVTPNAEGMQEIVVGPLRVFPGRLSVIFSFNIRFPAHLEMQKQNLSSLGGIQMGSYQLPK